MTTITREERERVAELLGYLAYPNDLERVRNGEDLHDTLIRATDIDRVAQALRDAAPQWREVTATEPAQGEPALIGNPTGCSIGVRDDSGDQRAWVINGLRLVDVDRTWRWMPLPAPPAVVAAPVIVSVQDRIATLEAELAKLKGGGQ